MQAINIMEKQLHNKVTKISLIIIVCSRGKFHVPLVSCIGPVHVFVLRSILCFWRLYVTCICFEVNFILLWSVVLAIGC